MHAQWEVDSQRPKPQGADQSQHSVEEGKQHRDQRREHDEDGPQHELGQREAQGAD